MNNAYQVIARRWRPQTFEDMVGQQHIVQTLQNAINTGRIAHAYLFVGPRGTGKTSLARVFAKALNASGGPSATPDAESEMAQAIMQGRALDVIEIDGASNNSVEQVRALREECQYAPAEGTFKIYIIDEVHMLSTAAFNALLKTLEEPPPHVKFIFATTEAHKVLPTITSRCQRFEFRAIADAQLIERLEKICTAEDIKITPEALAAIARLAAGGMRDAQSILDQMIAFATDPKAGITEADVLSVYGLVSAAQLEEMAAALMGAQRNAALELAEAWVSEGADLRRILADLKAHLRAHMLAGAKAENASQPIEPLARMVEALHTAEASFKSGLDERVHFEVALLSAIDASQTRAIDTLIKQLSTAANNAPPAKKKTSPVAAPQTETAETATSKKSKAPKPKAAKAPKAEPTSNPPSKNEANLDEALAAVPESLRAQAKELLGVNLNEVSETSEDDTAGADEPSK